MLRRISSSAISSNSVISKTVTASRSQSKIIQRLPQSGADDFDNNVGLVYVIPNLRIINVAFVSSLSMCSNFSVKKVCL